MQPKEYHAFMAVEKERMAKNRIKRMSTKRRGGMGVEKRRWVWKWGGEEDRVKDMRKDKGKGKKKLRKGPVRGGGGMGGHVLGLVKIFSVV